MLTSCLAVCQHIAHFWIPYLCLQPICWNTVSINTLWLLLKETLSNWIKQNWEFILGFGVLSQNLGDGAQDQVQEWKFLRSPGNYSLRLTPCLWSYTASQLFSECLTHSCLSANQFSCFLAYTIAPTVSKNPILNMSAQFRESSTN